MENPMEIPTEIPMENPSHRSKLPQGGFLQIRALGRHQAVLFPPDVQPGGCLDNQPSPPAQLEHKGHGGWTVGNQVRFRVYRPVLATRTWRMK